MRWAQRAECVSAFNPIGISVAKQMSLNTQNKASFVNVCVFIYLKFDSKQFLFRFIFYLLVLFLFE